MYNVYELLGYGIKMCIIYKYVHKSYVNTIFIRVFEYIIVFIKPEGDASKQSVPLN